MQRAFTVFHKRPNYDYHYVMKEWENEFKGRLECLGENTETYKSFSVPIEKEIKKWSRYNWGLFPTK